MSQADQSALVVVTCAMDSVDAQALTDEMTREVSALYGSTGGPSTLTREMFEPPDGRFLVGYLDEVPVAIAGFRKVHDGLAQAQRVFVAASVRGQGIAAKLMGHLEALAVDAGYQTLRLETGVRQPAAIRLYEGLGYTPIKPFAPYENDPLSRCYAKRIG
jgi:GNAT superfamily N-acetyltransferase